MSLVLHPTEVPRHASTPAELQLDPRADCTVKQVHPSADVRVQEATCNVNSSGAFYWHRF